MLITRQGDRDFVKVLDFGFAKVVSGMPEPGRGGPANALSVHGIIYGTPRYMAPEQCVAGPVDARTDLYALGLILYEMLTGVPPFTDPEALDIIRHQIYTPVPKMATVAPSVPIPTSLEAVVMRLTEKEPENRYASATQALAALTEVAAQEGLLPAEASVQIPASPSRPVVGKDASGDGRPAAPAEQAAITQPPNASVRLSVNESQILSEEIAGKPIAQEVTRPALAAPTVGVFNGASSPDQKTGLLPQDLRAAKDHSLSRRIKARLPVRLQRVPLPLLLLVPVSLLGLLLALLLAR
jgi:serine/threonine protein kinase